jgi:hypothetical protein
MEYRDDLRRFARSHVQLEDMATRYPHLGLSPDDVEQTGTGAKSELPRDRVAERHAPSEEPTPSDWVADVGTDENGNEE